MDDSLRFMRRLMMQFSNKMFQTLEEFLINLGGVLVILLTLAPGPAILRAWKNQKTEGLSTLFMLSCNYCGLFWMIYSYQISNLSMMYYNIPPFLIGLTWLCVCYAIEKRLAVSLLKYVVVTGLITAAILKWFDLNATGTIAVVANLGIVVAPIEFIMLVLKEKNPKRIDFNILMASTLTSLIWTAFGWITNDIFVLIPNVFGLYMALVQVTVFLWANGTLPHSFLAPLANLQGYKKTD